jgi:hypothetical protein
VIKRFTFFDDSAPLTKSDDSAASAVVCQILPELSDRTSHSGILIEWFSEAPPCDPGRSVLAGEEVKRGSDWLGDRRGSGGDRMKHMALARRAAGLTPQQFSERWRGRAGTVGSSSGPAVVIPERARGLAYAQNHVVDPPERGWLYDAINEVWFDDLDDLRYRIDWFAKNMTGGAEDDLVSAATFVAVVETPLK